MPKAQFWVARAQRELNMEVSNFAWALLGYRLTIPAIFSQIRVGQPIGRKTTRRLHPFVLTGSDIVPSPFCPAVVLAGQGLIQAGLIQYTVYLDDGSLQINEVYKGNNF